MKQIKSKARKWGNSIGVTIPKEVAEKEGVKEGQEVRIMIMNKDKTTVGDLFRKAKKNPLPEKEKSTEESLEEIDKELKSKVTA